MLHVDRRTLQNAVRNVLDGELLNRYLYLSTMERGELAKKIGTTPDIVSEPDLVSEPPAPPAPPSLSPPSPASRASPVDPGRPLRDRPCHRPLLDPVTGYHRGPCALPHSLFVQKTKKKICLI